MYMELYINTGLLLLILFMLYTNDSILQTNTVLNKGFIVLLIIIISNNYGMNSGLLAAACAIIMIHNTNLREYFEDTDITEDDVKNEDITEEEDMIEKEAKETQMNQTELDRIIKTASETATMEATGLEHQTPNKEKEEPASQLTSPSVSEGLQNKVV